MNNFFLKIFKVSSFSYDFWATMETRAASEREERDVEKGNGVDS